MTGRYVVTELGQTYCAVFDFDVETIVAAIGVATTSSDELAETAERVFEAWMSDGFIGMTDVHVTGSWLNRERNEGRATIIVANFEVSV